MSSVGWWRILSIGVVVKGREREKVERGDEKPEKKVECSQTSYQRKEEDGH